MQRPKLKCDKKMCKGDRWADFGSWNLFNINVNRIQFVENNYF